MLGYCTLQIGTWKTLERQSRQSEQEMVMEEIVEIAEEESCDLVWLPATSSTLQPRLPGQKPSFMKQ